MLSENEKIVPIFASANYGAGVDMDSFKMHGADATIIMTFGAVTGDAILKIYSGATAGAKTSALPFKIAVSGGAIGSASADYLGAWTDVVAASGATLTGATYTTKTGVVELSGDAVDTANDEEWITCELSAAASSGIMHAVAVVTSPRYTGNRSATLLA